jgi:hypothetical protein
MSIYGLSEEQKAERNRVLPLGWLYRESLTFPIAEEPLSFWLEVSKNSEHSELIHKFQLNNSSGDAQAYNSILIERESTGMDRVRLGTQAVPCVQHPETPFPEGISQSPFPLVFAFSSEVWVLRALDPGDSSRLTSLDMDFPVAALREHFWVRWEWFEHHFQGYEPDSAQGECVHPEPVDFEPRVYFDSDSRLASALLWSSGDGLWARRVPKPGFSGFWEKTSEEPVGPWVQIPARNSRLLLDFFDSAPLDMARVAGLTA